MSIVGPCILFEREYQCIRGWVYGTLVVLIYQRTYPEQFVLCQFLMKPASSSKKFKNPGLADPVF
jgi:hypothetical protein